MERFGWREGLGGIRVKIGVSVEGQNDGKERKTAEIAFHPGNSHMFYKASTASHPPPFQANMLC